MSIIPIQTKRQYSGGFTIPDTKAKPETKVEQPTNRGVLARPKQLENERELAKLINNEPIMFDDEQKPKLRANTLPKDEVVLVDPPVFEDIDLTRVERPLSDYISLPKKDSKNTTIQAEEKSNTTGDLNPKHSHPTQSKDSHSTNHPSSRELNLNADSNGISLHVNGDNAQIHITQPPTGLYSTTPVYKHAVKSEEVDTSVSIKDILEVSSLSELETIEKQLTYAVGILASKRTLLEAEDKLKKKHK